MVEKARLFQSITLENLMLHENAKIDLGIESISLITGANGSGKTQILDGLLLCLGHIPARAKAKGVGSLVGKNDDFAKIILELNNPLMNGRRAISTMDKDLNGIINFDTFIITAKISRDDSSVTYYINNSRTIVRGRLITRGDIRRLFESIGVNGENKLAFTGEGTVDEFASKSAKRKLDALLEVTGLKQYREEVIAAQETLKASIQEIEPLKRKYETESKLLSLWSNAMKIINQKKQLMALKRKLETELSWSLVVRVESQLENINKERLKVIQQKSENERAIHKKEEEISLANKKLKILHDELQLIEEQEGAKNRKLIILESQINNEEENIINFEKEIERYSDQKSKMEKILGTKSSSAKDRQLRDKQETLAVKNLKLSMIQEKFTKAEKELARLKKKILIELEFDSFSSEEQIFTGEKRTNYEETLITAARVFAQKIHKQQFENDIIGPLVSFTSMKEKERSWERAVKNLLGNNLFAFIATTDEAYRYAKRLYDETWPRWKPPISVYKVSEEDAGNAAVPIRKPEYKEIYNVAVNLIEGNPYILGLLKRITKGAVAEDNHDPVSLTKVARDAKVNILTKSGNSFYLSHGGFGRPPAPMNTPFGWKIGAIEDKGVGEIIDEQKIRITIAHLEKDIRDLKLDEIKTLQEISRLHIELQALGMPDDKLVGKIETINEIIAAIEVKMKECKIHQNELKFQLTEVTDDFGTYSIKKSETKKSIVDLKEVIDTLRIENHVLEEKSSRLLTLEINHDTEYNDLLEEKKRKETLALEKGERLEEIRNYSEIREELSRIEGNLESISISDVDEEKIDAQRIKVDSLKTYMGEREEHITNLRADLEARLAFWSGELKDVISNITKSMKLLLGGIFERIKLSVDNITNPEEAGLHIEAITKGKTFRDFRELSGGEKVLAIEGLILAMHTLTDSPIHAIDEFTQRLDEKNKALAFSIAIRTQKLASESSRFMPQFILLCPDALNVDVSENINHMVVSEMKVVKAEVVRQ